MIHVAILKPNYIRDILAGHKTVESRLTKTMQPPHGKVAQGERLFLKASGGPFMATALAGQVLTFIDQCPRDIDHLRKRYGKDIGGDDAYWGLKRDSRFATLITLHEVEPITVGPKYKAAYMKAWYVLDDQLSPVRDWAITAGALRNHYAMLPGKIHATTGLPITLELPGGEVVQTQFASGRRLRWRGWGPTYAAAGVQPGDLLRYVAVGTRRYAVQFVRR